MSQFENLTSKIVEKSPSRAKAKEKRLRKGRQSDDWRASSKPLSDSESKLEEQVQQRKKIKINCPRAKANERKECEKGSGGDE